ncbi:MAG: hypothetical protein WC511_00990 [Candidatus Pacearchaeota archaeon]
MEMPFQQMFGVGSGTELIYSFVIMLCSLMVFFGTKQIYELSSHKGIKYFRLAFLFFAVAYFARYFIKFFLMAFGVGSLHELSYLFFDPTGILTTFIFMYLSSISVFYLLYSVVWKKLEDKKIYLVHIAAILIAFVSILSRDGIFLLFVNLFLFIIVSLTFYFARRNSKKKKHTFYAVYMLLVFFWILNILDILIPSFFQGFQIIIYLFSISIFLTILYRVIKKTGD